MNRTPSPSRAAALALCVLSAAACIGAEPASPRLNVMVLTLPDPKFEGNIYKYPLEKIGAAYSVYTTEQLDEAMARLKDFDLVMLGLLVDANKLQQHLEDVRRWVSSGGGFCVFDACDGRLFADFCKALAGGGEGAAIDCRGCAGWLNTTRYGFVLDPEVVHPLRCFPRRVRYECRQWHCLRPGGDWATVATCSGPEERHPVVAVRRIGRGFVYVAAMQQRWSSVAENLRAYLMCCRLGLEPIACEPPRIRPGKERLLAKFRAFDGVDKVSAELSIADAKGSVAKQRKVFKANQSASGEIAVSFPVAFKMRGEAGVRLVLKTALGEQTVVDEKVSVPEAAAVSGPLYRNRLSAFRRTDAFSVRVEAYPDGGRTKSDRVAVKILDPNGSQIAAAKAAFPADIGQNEVVVKVPLPLSAEIKASDGYRVVAAVQSGGKVYRAESALTVVGAEHPGEVTVDEDMTLLVDGKPFFPVGIYHLRPEYFGDAADMGFNTVQTFQWFSRSNESFRQAEGLGLKVFFENNEKQPGGFVHMPGKYGNEKSMLMWYLPDEPLHEVDTAFAEEVAGILGKDVHHPMVAVDYNAPRFESNAARCDILAPDCYAVKAGLSPSQQQYLRIVDSMDAARSAVRGMKPVLHVLGAFGHETETDYMMTAFLSIARDARGLMWYAYDEGDGKTGVRHHEESRRGLVSTIERVNRVVPYLLDPVRRPFEVDAGNGKKAFGIVCGSENCAVIVVNPTAAAVAMPTVPEQGGAKAEELFAFEGGQAGPGMVGPFSVRAVAWTKKAKKGKGR